MAREAEWTKATARDLVLIGQKVRTSAAMDLKKASRRAFFADFAAQVILRHPTVTSAETAMVLASHRRSRTLLLQAASARFSPR